jgi:ABC-type uncharacterized transport system auxiliary subunit
MKRVYGKILLAMLTLFLYQCGSVPSTHYYQIEYQPKPVKLLDTPLPYVVMINDFETDLIYRDDKIVYRDSPYQVKYYNYRRWIAPPQRLVSEAIFSQIQQAGIFEIVTNEPIAQKTDLILTGRIRAFEEWDEATSWYGHVKIDFQLLKADTREIIWQNSFTQKQPVAINEPVEVVKAISAATQQIVHSAMTEIVDQLKQ